ncbi:hypothetical protein BKA70DRAFT_1486596 [Coprinopsis sp. MPI-PUGE-AT-0042]|nr:hypothetical protein BKA70DRAFT_1486596 [Coprinopsis sp. MPI-PUGE-AT-0042]
MTSFYHRPIPVANYGLACHALSLGASTPPFTGNVPNYPQYTMSTMPTRLERDISPLQVDTPSPKPLPTDPLKVKHVPRPRNAFMIFRSSFWAEAKINRTVEHDHRHISRIIGHCWNKMSEDEKDVWRQKALNEKAAHERKYPGYRFCPTARTKKPVKRKVKRNGAVDLARCEKLADLLLSGKTGYELSLAAQALPGKPVRASKAASKRPTQPTPMPATVVKYASEEPPFRSPLLPPQPMYEESVGSCSSMECSPTMEFSMQAHLPPQGLYQEEYINPHPVVPPFQHRQIALEAPYFPTSEYAVFPTQPAVQEVQFQLNLTDPYVDYTAGYAICSNSLPPIPHSVFEQVPWIPEASYQHQYYPRSTVSGVSM